VLYLRAAIDSQQLPIEVRGVAYKKLGLALVGVGNMTEAEQSLLAALEQSPPDYQAYCSLPEVYKQMGMVNEAAQAGKNCSKLASK
jgi:Tfp pilus assembly protein PilF